MKKLFQRIVIACSLASMMICSAPAFAATGEPTSLTTTTIQYGDKTIEVPVIQTDMKNARSGEGESTLSIYVPASEEALEYNENVIKQIRRAGLDDDKEMFDPSQYVRFHSKIVYTMDYYDGNPRVDMQSFSITKTENETIYPINVAQPSAMAYQLGFEGPSNIYTLTQKESHSVVAYNKTYSVPAEWVPVLKDDHSLFKGMEYTIKITYIKGGSSTYDEVVKFQHRLT